jgi:hypothetical protein
MVKNTTVGRSRFHWNPSQGSLSGNYPNLYSGSTRFVSRRAWGFSWSSSGPACKCRDFILKSDTTTSFITQELSYHSTLHNQMYWRRTTWEPLGVRGTEFHDAGTL